MPDITIHPLAEVPSARAPLERLFVREWPAWYGPNGPGCAADDLLAASQTGALPLALLAMDARGGTLGCAMLKAQSVGAERGYGPFLAGFVVAAEARQRGAGTALVAAVEDAAMRLGHTALYGATDSAGGILMRRGWQAIDTTPSSRGEMVIYRLKLRSQSSSDR